MLWFIKGAILSSPPTLYAFIAIVVDEMHIKEDLVYDKHTGELIGFTNLGEINSHLKLQYSLEEQTSVTSMVRGLFSALQFPYTQFPCANLSGDLMYLLGGSGEARTVHIL